MPRVAKRTAVELTPSTPSITTFGRVSKTNTLNTTPAKKAVATDVPSKKRKASVGEAQNVEPEQAATRSKRACRRTQEPRLNEVKKEDVKLEEKAIKGKRVAKAPAPRQSAHKPSADTLITKSRASSRKVQTRIDATFKRTSPTNKTEFSPHLAELVTINKAFVKTTLLHMVHAGSAVPVDLRTLLPSITSSFGKRGVTIEDVRRCVGIQSTKDHASPFVVSDYGRGKVCVELARGLSLADVKEEKLCKQFEQNLRILAGEKAEDAMDVDIPLGALSLGDLPQVEVANRELGVGSNPQLRKGHQALTSLQQSVAAQREEKMAKAQAPPTLNADGSKMSLLDRLRAKQLQTSAASPALTGPEAARRAALNRVPDVAATLAMLCLSKPASLPRQAFTMGVVLEKLKDSLRVPLSRDESMAAVRLIAGEVAPEWVRVLVIGGRENVVLQRGGQPGERAIQERVDQLLGQ